MYQALLIIFLLVAVSLVVLIIMQQDKSVGMGAYFGSGASNTLFGSSGFSNLMTRITALLATFFFILSLVLGNLNSKHGQKDGQWNNLSQAQQVDKKPTEVSLNRGNDLPR